MAGQEGAGREFRGCSRSVGAWGVCGVCGFSGVMDGGPERRDEQGRGGSREKGRAALIPG